LRAVAFALTTSTSGAFSIHVAAALRASRCAYDLSVWILACDGAQVRFEIFKTHRCEFLALGRLRHWPPPFVIGLALRRFSSPRSCADSLLLFLAQFLEARIIAQRVEHGIEPEQRRSERRIAGRQCTSVRDRE
jgi:hypothetical protein